MQQTAQKQQAPSRAVSFPQLSSSLLFIVMLLAAIIALLLFVLPTEEKNKDFYSFKSVNIRGKLISLEKYRGSISLVVNVASECGFTENHYKDLQQLQRELGPMHFNVLGFPCNQFGNQEPGSDQEVERFVRRTYGVSFPMFSKINVKGPGANAAFKYLTVSRNLLTSVMNLLNEPVFTTFGVENSKHSPSYKSWSSPYCQNHRSWPKTPLGRSQTGISGSILWMRMVKWWMFGKHLFQLQK
ncbi:glutathione peroxidase 7 isoform X1 [Rhincodon typus]|uniref:glutathione peroxidase 7 isoform X1 n=1 Tax=Rhincodon typus TaxID=259920 RepID=UPI0020302BF2|nr:glutathione peroxidase 7 isoform X1 [Rhincodon typus]